MTIQLKDGRDYLWQWDTGRKVVLTDEDELTAEFVHFENDSAETAYVMEVSTDSDGNRVADIPNELMADGSTKLTCYPVDVDANGIATIQKTVFKIKERQQPNGYTSTQTEVIQFDEAILRCKNSATASESSATASANSATESGNSASVATAKANEAINSATSAEESASTAKKKATEASESAVTASSKADDASKSASEASTFASNASDSATSARESEQEAQNHLNEIEDDFGFSVVDGALCHTADGTIANPVNDAVAQDATMHDICEALETQNDYFAQLVDRGSIIEEKEIFMNDVTAYCATEKSGVTSVANNAVTEINSVKADATNTIDSKVTSAESNISNTVAYANANIDSKISASETRIASTEQTSIQNIMNNFGLSLDDDGNLCSEAENEEGGTTGKDAIVLNNTMIRLAVAIETQNNLLQQLINKE